MKERVLDKRDDRRIELRFDKAFPVVVKSEIFGNISAIARNISLGGMMIEMFEPLPLGSFVTVHFGIPDSRGDVVAYAEVKHHYCFNFSAGKEPGRAQGIGLRFVEFVKDSRDRWHETFASERVLH
ncbi:MAG: PilZ domain-containing protein [Proteobacteria bacterium]|nr:PilZ domain-containing protein [Pseudomonadota bacterium]